VRAWSIAGNTQRLDGGAMFGHVPRALWSRWMTPDADHRLLLACRALLVEDSGRHFLFETGIGAFFPPDQRARYGVEEPEHVLCESLAAVGLRHEDIDVVVLSHLHFDHAGGLLERWHPGRAPALLFPRATFVVSLRAIERARHPHLRDRASFVPELLPLLEASGRLEVVDREHCDALGHLCRFHASEGHTPGLVLAELAGREGPLVFGSDLVPGCPWLHTPVTMGYDRAPELLVDEKEILLADLASRRGRVFFTHDPEVAVARVGRDDRGRYVPLDPLPDLSGVEL
jgi:glyoxylase-like metal-dependent hydrolase (beta-lactamase superfamily II)